MIFKDYIAFILRIILYWPVAFLAYLFDGLQQLFGRISDGLFDIARSTKQITHAPYVSEIEAGIKKMSEERRKKLLEELRGNQ